MIHCALSGDSTIYRLVKRLSIKWILVNATNPDLNFHSISSQGNKPCHPSKLTTDQRLVLVDLERNEKPLETDPGHQRACGFLRFAYLAKGQGFHSSSLGGLKSPSQVPRGFSFFRLGLQAGLDFVPQCNSSRLWRTYLLQLKNYVNMEKTMLTWNLSSSSLSMKNHVPFEGFCYAFWGMAISDSAMSTFEFWVLFLERYFRLSDPSYK